MPGYLDFIDHITANLQGKAAPSTLAHIAELHARIWCAPLAVTCR